MVALWERLNKTVTLHHIEAHTGKGDALSLGNAKADELATMATGNTPTVGGSIFPSSHLPTAATGGAGSCLPTTTGGTVTSGDDRFNQLANRLSTEPKHNDAPRTMLRFDPYSTPSILSLL